MIKKIYWTGIDCGALLSFGQDVCRNFPHTGKIVKANNHRSNGQIDFLSRDAETTQPLCCSPSLLLSSYQGWLADECEYLSEELAVTRADHFNSSLAWLGRSQSREWDSPVRKHWNITVVGGAKLQTFGPLPAFDSKSIMKPGLASDTRTCAHTNTPLDRTSVCVKLLNAYLSFCQVISWWVFEPRTLLCLMY